MKQRILIFCTVLTTLGLTAFGVINWNDSETNQLKVPVNEELVMHTVALEKPNNRTFTDFVYDVGPRFSPIKKGKLDTAKSINDFLGEDEIQKMVTLKSVNISIVKNKWQADIREIGYSNELTEAQLKLLQSFDYSTNFSIMANYEKMNTETGKLEDDYANPHLTIVPEKQAKYVYGKYALIEYLKKNSKEAIADVQEDRLRPAKLHFTVTKKGTIENVRIDNHSGYPAVDKTMIELISNTLGAWEPAENAKGEKVNQELVISFGLMGC